MSVRRTSKGLRFPARARLRPTDLEERRFTWMPSGYNTGMLSQLLSLLMVWSRDERGGVPGTILAVAVVVVIVIAAIIAFLIPNGDG